MKTASPSSILHSPESGDSARMKKVVGEQIREVLKKLRLSQPLNYVATSAVRALLARIGRQPEFVIKHLHRAGKVKRRLPNGRMLRLQSRADDWVSNQIYWRGWNGYEPETVPLFFRLAARACVTSDVGAYIGFYTLLAAHANPAGRVFAFEPLPAAYARLQRNIELNRLANVRCVASAVGETDGVAEFFHMATALPCSSSLSYEFMRSAGEAQRALVPVLTLDRFVREQGLARVDLVKIDTESTEPEVLRGRAKTLRRDQPMIFCEVLQGRGAEKPLEEILRSLGYRYYLLTSDGPALRDQIEGHPAWLNYLFTTLEPSQVAKL
jgi:FkbM family methyltransferase